jgi:O-antigen/teichoic acid export membrane protein
MKSWQDGRGFIRAVSMLAGSTALGHLVTALALPFATRLYTPEEFSSLAAFTAVVAVIGVAACLRFDVAIPMCERGVEAVNLLSLSMLLAASISTALAVVAWALGDEFAAVFDGRVSASHFLLVPLGVMSLASYSALQGWLLRFSRFDTLARAKVGQSVASAGTQLGLGWHGAGAAGLVLANVIYIGGSWLWLVWHIGRRHSTMLRRVRLRRMLAMGRRYDRFPKYSTLEALANSASIQVPLVLIAALAAGPQAGFVLLAMQVMQVPIAVIGTAVGQVYVSQAPAAHREGKLEAFTSDVLLKLLRVGTGPLLFAGIIAPGAFPVLFGTDWERSGWMVSWMTPWFLAQFVASPVSMALHVTGKQRAALSLQVFGLIVRVLTVCIAAQLAPSIIAESYAVSGLVFYVVYLAVVLHATNVRLSELCYALGRTVTVVAAWVIGGLIVAWGLSVLAARVHP